MRHFHRNGRTMVIDGVLYFGVAECKFLWVSPEGVFATREHPEGGYRGSRASNGYRHVGVAVRLGSHITAHQMVYEICTGTEIVGEIDHINCNKEDNRLVNLRVVRDRKENMANPITREKVVRNARKQFAILNANSEHQRMASMASACRRKRI